MKTAIKTMIAAAAVAVAAFAGNSSLAAPASFAYQGVILEQSGQVPATKNRTVEFRIYDGPTSKNVLWGRAYNVLLDSNGLFNVPLSDETGSPISGVAGTGLAKILADNANTALYIGLTVDGSSGEISPRQAILAVPYAMHAADAAQATGNFPVAGKVTASGLDVSGNTTLKTLTVTTNLAVNSGNVTVAAPGGFVGHGTTPVGGIIMWSGNPGAIPAGWALCDGSNGTPDLRGRFVVGYNPGDGDYNTVGRTGGEKKHTLTVSEMPKHKHSYTFRCVSYDWRINYNNQFYCVDPKYINDYPQNENSRDTNSTGGGEEHENRPPYYTLCFIMRVK